MVFDQTTRLHKGIANCFAYKLKATFFRNLLMAFDSSVEAGTSIMLTQRLILG